MHPLPERNQRKVNRTEIVTALQDVFEQVLGRDVLLSEDTTAEDVEGWDSLAHITLILSVEQRFGVTFTGAEIADAASVKSLIDLIEKKAAA